MTETLEFAVVKRSKVMMAEEMLSAKVLADRWHCNLTTIHRVLALWRDTGGKRGLEYVGAGRRIRVPAHVANRYAKGDDFLRT